MCSPEVRWFREYWMVASEMIQIGWVKGKNIMKRHLTEGSVMFYTEGENLICTKAEKMYIYLNSS